MEILLLLALGLGLAGLLDTSSDDEADLNVSEPEDEEDASLADTEEELVVHPSDIWIEAEEGIDSVSVSSGSEQMTIVEGFEINPQESQTDRIVFKDAEGEKLNEHDLLSGGDYQLGVEPLEDDPTSTVFSLGGNPVLILQGVDMSLATSTDIYIENFSENS